MDEQLRGSESVTAVGKQTYLKHDKTILHMRANMAPKH